MDALLAALHDYIRDINNYEIVQKLREGGFATIYIAKEKSLGDIYAAKVINEKGKKLVDDQMILREIDIFSKIKGPGILPFHGISLTNFEGEKYPTIFTEYMPNGSLGEIIRQESLKQAPVEWNNTTKMTTIYGICKAMSFLHKNGIIHKDLKPDNILLDKKFYPHVSDFGMAKLTSNSQNAKAMNGGTPIFMAPEIYMNVPYDSKVDVYAFGMLLYHLLVGKEPFGEFKRNLFMLWHKILSGARPLIPETVPNCFQELIKRCWAGKPEQRPTFDEIIELIDSIQITLPDVDVGSFEEYKNSISHSS